MVRALLLLGPPGAGKTPLGEYLATRSLAGARVFHFDFGQELRNLLKNGPDRDFSPEEINRVEEVLSQSRLFEKNDEKLVKKILDCFIKKREIGPEDWVVLNGLPRHADQVDWISGVVEIKLVVNLICPLEISLRRIASGTLEDRSERGDDSPEAIARRYKIYLERTRPLLEFFLGRKTPVVEVQVSETTTPGELWQQLISSESFKKAVNG